MAELAQRLDLLGLRKVRLVGEISAEGQRDWHLTAHVGGTVIQACALTLEPVTTRIDVPVERRYLADYTDPAETEAESPDDDTQEPLPDAVDLADLASECLALALPDFPRADGAALEQAAFAPPGAGSIEDAKVNPFEALAALKQTPEKDEHS